MNDREKPWFPQTDLGADFDGIIHSLFYLIPIGTAIIVWFLEWLYSLFIKHDRFTWFWTTMVSVITITRYCARKYTEKTCDEIQAMLKERCEAVENKTEKLTSLFGMITPIFVVIWIMIGFTGVFLMPDEQYRFAGYPVLSACLMWLFIALMFIFPTGIFHSIAWKVYFKRKEEELWNETLRAWSMKETEQSNAADQ
jgi:hypothetical protein